MSDRDTVTLEDLRGLLRAENIKPEDIFSEDALKPLRDAARAEGYSEGMFRQGILEAQKKGEWLGTPKPEDKQDADKAGEAEKYIDPAQNPLIKTD
jgi:hypothetical protein